ncbi:cyclophilin-like family protein [Magnetospirillum sp. SS-4]|uniref:cyclophilin-like family protein n=1 Tax=Magnetospirillum sp. SS-4 TaxID=2681465 RepID=UPI00138234A5|nr:cyclophilin-like family protein [Magnetospirillum sp. SS-4]CAA7626313.1 conserved hypothetical protein [Magnetospirillum sp. SS-4]
MPKLKITIGRIAVEVRPYDTPTAAAVLAAAPFESRATIWPGEVYFQAPFHAPREEGAHDVVELGEMAFRPEGEVLIMGYGPTPCSEGDEIRLASASNIWGKVEGDAGHLRDLAGIEAGELVRVEVVE